MQKKPYKSRPHAMVLTAVKPAFSHARFATLSKKAYGKTPKELTLPQAVTIARSVELTSGQKTKLDRLEEEVYRSKVERNSMYGKFAVPEIADSPIRANESSNQSDLDKIVETLERGKKIVIERLMQTPVDQLELYPLEECVVIALDQIRNLRR